MNDKPDTITIKVSILYVLADGLIDGLMLALALVGLHMVAIAVAMTGWLVVVAVARWVLAALGAA